MLRKRDGFTLVELLVALIISGVLAGVIFQVLQGQSNFVRLQSARQDVQQNTRGGLELLVSELRAVPPVGLREASADGIGIRSPVIWGVVCQPAPTATGSLDIAVPAGSPAFQIDADWSRVVVDVGPSPQNPMWTGFAAVSDVQVPATTTCTGLPAGAQVLRVTHGGTLTSGGATPVAPSRGSRVYLSEWIKYGVKSLDGERWLVRTRGNSGTAEKIAGPLPADGVSGAPLQFAYFTRAGGATALALPISDPAQQDSVNRIQVIVGTQSRRKVGTQHQVQFDTATVFLRNRP